MASIQRGHLADSGPRRFRAGGSRENIRDAGHLQVHDIKRDPGLGSARSLGIGEQRVEGDASVFDQGGGGQDTGRCPRLQNHGGELRLGGDAERDRESADAQPISNRDVG